METVGPILIPVGCLLGLAWFSGMLNLMLGPLLNASTTARSPTRFLLTDFIWLVLQLQISMAIAVRAFPTDMPIQIRISALVLLSLPVLAFWYASLQVVSWTGIVRPLRRAAVFLVLLPGASLMTICLPLLLLSLVASLAASDVAGPKLQSIQVLTIEVLIALAVTAALRWLAAWVVPLSRS